MADAGVTDELGRLHREGRALATDAVDEEVVAPPARARARAAVVGRAESDRTAQSRERAAGFGFLPGVNDAMNDR